LTGRGRVVMRAKHEIETTATGRQQLIFTEIPYMVNKHGRWLVGLTGILGAAAFGILTLVHYFM
ncbi:MAG: hypothetical protein IJC19_00715, partial [Clostridia bacterium]|nr:hypothetical protein [Clostridia bacterium]